MACFRTIACLLLLLSAVAVPAFADDWDKCVRDGDMVITSNRDSTGKMLRGNYLVNPASDNWSVGFDGGAQTFLSEIMSPKVTGTVGVWFVKWFSPSLGIRVGLQGGNGREVYKAGYSYDTETMGKHRLWDNMIDSEGAFRFHQYSAHIDLLWNVINTIGGYRYDRVYGLSPYLSGGYYNVSQAGPFHPNHDNELFAGIGLLNEFRVHPRVNIVLDLRADAVSGRYHWYRGGLVCNLSASLGVSFNINRWYWRSIPSVRVKEIIREVPVPVSDRELAEAKMAAVAPVPIVPKIKAGTILYYNVDSSDLNETELRHLNDFVNMTLEKDPDHVFRLIGSADKGTGTYGRNVTLSWDRASKVKRRLIGEYGVKAENVVIVSTVVSDKFSDGGFDRSVIVLE